jgi:hypothetical protein
MRSLRTAVILAMACLLVGCQSGKFRNPLALKAKETEFSAEELAAVDQTVEQQTSTPVSFTNRLSSQSRTGPTVPRVSTTRRS